MARKFAVPFLDKMTLIKRDEMTVIERDEMTVIEREEMTVIERDWTEGVAGTTRVVLITTMSTTVTVRSQM